MQNLKNKRIMIQRNSWLKDTGQEWHPQGSQAKTTAVTKEHRGSSRICQKASWWSSRRLEKHPEESQIEYFEWGAVCSIWLNNGTAIDKKNIIVNNKAWWWQCDGLGLLCCLRTRTTCYHWRKMNSAVYQMMLKENVRPSGCGLKLSRFCLMQQDNDPKHTNMSTSECFRKNKVKVLERPS